MGHLNLIDKYLHIKRKENKKERRREGGTDGRKIDRQKERRKRERENAGFKGGEKAKEWKEDKWERKGKEHLAKSLEELYTSVLYTWANWLLDE